MNIVVLKKNPTTLQGHQEGHQEGLQEGLQDVPQVTLRKIQFVRFPLQLFLDQPREDLFY